MLRVAPSTTATTRRGRRCGRGCTGSPRTCASTPLRAERGGRCRPMSGRSSTIPKRRSSPASRSRGCSRCPSTRRRRRSSEASSASRQWPRPAAAPRSPARALLLREVLDLPSVEVAELLDVAGGLQRAAACSGAAARGRCRPRRGRVAIGAAGAGRSLRRRFRERRCRGIDDELATDVVMEMPPMWNWYRGVEAYAGFMRRGTGSMARRGEPSRCGRTVRPASPPTPPANSTPCSSSRCTPGRATRTTVYRDETVFEFLAPPMS